MKVYLASVESTGTFKKNMRMYLAESGEMWEAYFIKEYFKDAYILQSFYYADEFTERYIIPNAADFLLDSGAFTFMQSTQEETNWEEYINRYADFINRNNVDKFFELDIDSVVGYEKVLQYRQMLEKLTGKKSIPVWHKSRGLKEFQRMCREYDYVAIGGIVSGEIKKSQYRALPMMIQEAHRNRCKIHGLGFTNLTWLPICHWDSVDSTAWTTGNRYGFLWKFDRTTMRKIDVPKGKRLSDAGKVSLLNYSEWLKYSKYAERNL